MKKSATWRKTKPEAPPPIDTLQAKARRLPMPGPGITVRVPVHLWPAYMELYGLRALEPGEVQGIKDRGTRKPDGVVWVTRTPKEDEQHGNNNHIDG